MTERARKLAIEVLNETAEMLKSGKGRPSVKIGLTTFGSEVGVEALVAGAKLAMQRDSGIEVVIIGPCSDDSLKSYPAEDEETVHKTLENLLDSGEIHGAVTMHYPFPIGVSTVGKVVTPARGKTMYIATSTGTSDTNRVQAMVKNAVYGIAVAKADGIENPTVGILNIEGARQVERQLKAMQEKGYSFKWGESARSDGGQVLRGNDLIMGSVDVLVTDTLTGNVLMKMFSAYSSGGNYETTGYGYGPGIGKGFNRLIHILSRASGTPVIANAIEYCASMVRGKLLKIKEEEIAKAERAGWIVEAPKAEKKAEEETVEMPPEKVVESQISGIDILEIDDAVKALWKNKIYASSGMGCTGPVVLVAKEDYEKALEVLKNSGFLG
ncbi:glycine/sarcosine/betaine reductase complex component C subunit alpha [Thermosyntropha sp.]|uniref:glycine/sarcosine/betaine reductase complex component C subunit alpha n=1 Tax=Thermosyntropha sp. TaxID=2740820 RepID=UPI0025E87E10|nr:glycine/sarcosine/betaine reductase complex component C subunit alpha [Thermosyntropha sp.]